MHLQGNLVRFYENQPLCNGNSKLEYLDLSDNRLLANITIETFEHCTKLHFLKLSKNSLTGNFFNATSFSTTLEILDLSNNQIQYLTPDAIDKLNNLRMDNSSVLTIKLTGNPLSCDCRNDALHFTSWLINPPPHLKFVDLEKSTCSSRRGIVQLTSINDNEINTWRTECYPNNTEEIIGSTLGSVCTVLVLMILTFVFKQRWQIRYKLFQIRQVVSNKTSDQVCSFKYDAFVAYSAEDRFWVHGVLMKTLENFYGFNLCIHYRDFPVGALIHETIIEFVGKSREIILVVSDFFLSSEWCQFELDEALRQCNLRQTRLIVIKLGNPRIDQHLTMLHVMGCHVYLEWDDGPEAKRTLFWARLVGKMYSDETGCSLSCCKYGTRAIDYEQVPGMV